ncbi:MAG: NfeD family protein [Gammaproteobacteria bacterium]|nr:NfeD family protein [Gammaproteobacteria bacterium]
MDFSRLQEFELLAWHWWAIALIFVVLEALIPSGIFVGIAVSGAITGAIKINFPALSWEAQLGIFATITVVVTFIWRKIFKVSEAENQDIATKGKARAQVGKEFVLKLPLQNGFGEAELDDISWELKGPDTKAGKRVRVVGVDGSILVVYPLPEKKKET